MPTGEVVSATEQDFEPTERRSCHGVIEKDLRL
jgi:hypothetical protein